MRTAVGWSWFRGRWRVGFYPTAYWSQLGGVGKRDATLNWAWRAGGRDHAVYG